MAVATDNKELGVQVVVRKAHAEQRRFILSAAKRKVIRAGRRGGKTVGIAILAVRAFLAGKRVLYAAPTSEQTDAFWYEVKRALQPLVEIVSEDGKKVASPYKINESERFIEKMGTKNRLKAKTAWNADTLRGDFADLLIFDEYQLTDEDAWEVVGQPMLLDNNGDAVFIYTPPSMRSAGISKAKDPRHASKMFKDAEKKKLLGESWETFHFTSWDNPYISHDALEGIARDMSRETYRQEILAEDDEIQVSWLVYKSFNETLCKIKPFEIPTSWPVFTGHDFGSANPAALFFAQVRLPLPPNAPPYMRLNDMVCFREYLPGATSAPVHVASFREICQNWIFANKEWRATKSVGGNVNTEQQTRELYSMHGWSIQAPNITHVNAQIDRVVGLMELNKVYIFNSCIKWLEEIANCLWEPDSDGRPTNKVRDEAKYHLSACARYILSDFRPETVVHRSDKIPMVAW